MPGVLFLLLLPLTLLLIGTVGWHAKSAGLRATPRRVAYGILAGMFVLTLATIVGSSGDWVHLFWSVKFPLYGMFAAAGLLLVQVWSEDRRQHPRALFGWNGAVAALVALIVIGLLPAVLVALFGDARPVGRVSGSPFVALFDVVRYGFGGPVPELMEPVTRGQFERGLGSPPRFVTVPMGATFLAAAAWIGFVLLAFVGRVVRSGDLRRTVLLVLPAGVAMFLLLVESQERLERALYQNEPWLVRAYGPTLVLAGIGAVVLLVAVFRDGRRASLRPAVH